MHRTNRTACLVLGLLLCVVSRGRADSQDAGIPSYWGPIPAAADSAHVRIPNLRKSAWETAVDVPYYTVTAPLRLLTRATHASYLYLDEKRVVYRIKQLFGPRRRFGALLNFRGGGFSGVGGGLGFYHDHFLGEHNRLRIRQQTTTKGFQKLHLGMQFGAPESGPLEIAAGYRLLPKARYFGEGPDTKKDDRALYLHEQTWVGMSYARPMVSNVFGELEVNYSVVGARKPKKLDGDDQTVREVFGSELPLGYGTRSEGPTFAVSLRRDTTVGEGRPETGGVIRAKAGYFKSTDDSDVEFVTTRVEVERFVPLWFSQRALALRGLHTWIEDTGDAGIPFQRQMANDDPDLFRGYQDFRFRGPGLVLATAEYRWPIWVPRNIQFTGLDAYLLADAGQVFRSKEEISVPNLTASFGGGIRIANIKGFVGRFEVARSREETTIRLRGDQVFQFTHHDLFHGRDRVPMR